MPKPGRRGACATSQSFDLQRLFDLAVQAADSALASNYPRYVFEAALAKMAVLPALRPIASIVAAIESGAPLNLATDGQTGDVQKHRPATNIAPLAETSSPKSAAVSEKALSWVEFVGSVRDQSQQLLAALLRRVSA